MAALAAVLAAGVAAPVAAQRISGTVRETDGGRPIAGGFISLLNSEGDAVQADFTAADGIFSFTAPGPGRYRIRVERIGYVNWVTEPYEVAAGQPLTITVEVPPDPVRLGELRVEVTGSCLDDPSEGAALATVWEEARKALERAAVLHRQHPGVPKGKAAEQQAKRQAGAEQGRVAVAIQQQEGGFSSDQQQRQAGQRQGDRQQPCQPASHGRCPFVKKPSSPGGRRRVKGMATAFDRCTGNLSTCRATNSSSFAPSPGGETWRLPGPTTRVTWNSRRSCDRWWAFR